MAEKNAVHRALDGLSCATLMATIPAPRCDALVAAGEERAGRDAADVRAVVAVRGMGAFLA